MKIHVAVILTVAVQLGSATLSLAHPGSGIVVDAQGNAFVSDINRGLLKFGADGKVTVVLKEAGHYLTLDSAGKFSRMEFEKSDHWPRWFKATSPWSPTGLTIFHDELYVLEYTDLPPGWNPDDRKGWVPRVRKVERNGNDIIVATVPRQDAILRAK